MVIFIAKGNIQRQLDKYCFVIVVFFVFKS